MTVVTIEQRECLGQILVASLAIGESELAHRGAIDQGLDQDLIRAGGQAERDRRPQELIGLAGFAEVGSEIPCERKPDFDQA
jgi:hypothetical protein